MNRVRISRRYTNIIHHIYRSPFKNELNIFLFGDLQHGAPGFDEDAFEQFKAEFKSTKNAVALGLGDYSDQFRPTMRDRIIKATDDSTRNQLDKLYIQDHDKLIDKLAFLEGKLVGIHNGHHCHEFLNGTNSDQRLASALKAPYLGWIASTRICLSRQDDHSYSYTIISTHGQPNARRNGGAVAWLENNFLSSWIADQYCFGHNCKSINWTPTERNIIRRDGQAGVIRQLPRAINVGGFCRGYTDGWESSWVERMGFAPQPIGWAVIRLKIRQGIQINQERGNSNRKTKVLDVEQVSRHPV